MNPGFRRKAANAKNKDYNAEEVRVKTPLFRVCRSRKTDTAAKKRTALASIPLHKPRHSGLVCTPTRHQIQHEIMLVCHRVDALMRDRNTDIGPHQCHAKVRTACFKARLHTRVFLGSCASKHIKISWYERHHLGDPGIPFHWRKGFCCICELRYYEKWTF